jgi:hypothetical protein
MSSLSPEAYAVIEGRHSAPSGISAPTSKATYPSSVFSFRMRKASIVDEQGHLCRQLLQVNRRPGSSSTQPDRATRRLIVEWLTLKVLAMSTIASPAS